MKKKPRVLFLCTHNAARSQIAEALLRKYAGHRFEAISAGLEPTDVHPLTRQVLEEIGVAHCAQRARGSSSVERLSVMRSSSANGSSPMPPGVSVCGPHTPLALRRPDRTTRVRRAPACEVSSRARRDRGLHQGLAARRGGLGAAARPMLTERRYRLPFSAGAVGHSERVA
jgi:Low molecular weight phosphotyrosine protein phosphatase